MAGCNFYRRWASFVLLLSCISTSTACIVSSIGGGSLLYQSRYGAVTSGISRPEPTTNDRPTQFEPSQNSYGDGHDRFGQATPSDYSAAHGIQEFTQELILTFRNLGISDNVVFSPISVASLLSLLTLGTKGVTSQEIVRALGLSNSDNSTAYHSQYEFILRRLNYDTNNVIINTVSRIFVEETTPVSETFVSQAGEHYNCTVSFENFRERPVQTQTRVNQWVEDATQGKIKDFISSPFSPDTTFVAANTIYFNGAWETPFPVDFTMEGQFDTGVRNISVPMMTNVFDTKHYYSREFNLDITAIPCVGGELSMIIILPRESPRVKSIQALERQLDPNAIRELISKMKKTTVSLSLPRMRLNMKTNMVSSLKQLGINSIFSPTTSDFSGLTSKKPIWISEFLHEAIVEITETGTVAAAASGAMINRMGGHRRINVNKPAIMFIKDNVTRLPIFWMRLVEPDRVES
ncbi:serpin B6 [Hyalella azteca]|uniref:Serpin B6 n=1 Tax=Hyalella azteca TaxID=294128 RepID=A0A8B7N847_HYAAZ|nr:serpin B6 [Hyalella azteca]